MDTKRYILTRHCGAVAWIRSHVQIDLELTHVEDLSGFHPGDEVYGVFPLHLAAALCAIGVKCFHVEFDLPESLRGKEIAEADMDRLNARLAQYEVMRAASPPVGQAGLQSSCLPREPSLQET